MELNLTTNLIMLAVIFLSFCLVLLWCNKEKFKMNYKLEKLFAWIKWSCVIILNDFILGILLATWVYPLFVYPTRNIIRFFWYGCGTLGKIISFPGFIFLNDPEEDGKCDDYGLQDYRNKIGFPKPLEDYNFLQKWWISCMWSAWRNPVWNVHRFIKPKHNDHSKYDSVDIIEQYDDQELLGYWHNKTLDYCVLKYKNEQGEGVDNFGDIIDYSKSILGKNFVYYRVNGVLYFRYSKAWVNGNLAHELQLGTNGRRFKIRIKFKKLK